jgi:hypothetical protein
MAPSSDTLKEPRVWATPHEPSDAVLIERSLRGCSYLWVCLAYLSSPATSIPRAAPPSARWAGFARCSG